MRTIRSGMRRLDDAARQELSLESRFDLAYNAAHALALDQAHRKRNLAEYEGDVDVEELLVAALLRIAREVAKRVDQLMAT